MSDLGLNIRGNDTVGPMANKIANALVRVADQEDRIAKLSTRVGESYQQTAKGVQHLENEEAKRQSQVERAAARERSNEKKREAWNKKQIRDAAVITAGFVAAGAAATALGYAIAASAKSSGQAKAGATALAGAWTGGDGPRTIKYLDTLAQALGEKFATVRDEFIQFRQAGLKNDIAIKLIKLRGDLVAVGLSAEQADKQIEPVLQAKGAKAQANHLAQIAKAYGVVGDGSKAASTAGARFDAGLNRLDNVKTKALELIWVRIEPAIGKAANAVARFAGELLASSSGAAIIDAVANAFGGVADALTKTTEDARDSKTSVKDFIVTSINAAAGLGVGLINPIDSLNASLERGINNGSPYGEAMKKIGAGFDYVKDHLGYAYEYISGKVSDFYDLGSKVVTGFVSGITDKIGEATSAVGDFASKVSSSFKDTLGIHSPSRVFQGYGENTVRGFELGQQRALPSDLPLLQAAMTAPSGGGGGGSSYNITINMTAPDGTDAHDWAESIRREITRVLTSGALSRGET